MKTFTFTNLLLVTSLTLFTACSNKTPEVKKSKDNTSAYNIIGIAGVKTVSAKSEKEYMDSLPLAETIPVIETTYVEDSYADNSYVDNSYVEDSSIEVVSRPTRTINTRRSSNIEVISYASSRPVFNRLHQYDTQKLKREIEANAKRLLGIRYVWGATGPNKYDCSGFTQKIYRDAGIKIPRVSRDQAKVGNYVSYANLRKGDMVFFDTQKRKTGKVTHVGIYLGRGNFIHASSGAKKIVIYNFNRKSFYKKRFLWGRRVIQNNTQLASL